MDLFWKALFHANESKYLQFAEVLISAFREVLPEKNFYQIEACLACHRHLSGYAKSANIVFKAANGNK